MDAFGELFEERSFNDVIICAAVTRPPRQSKQAYACMLPYLAGDVAEDPHRLL